MQWWKSRGVSILGNVLLIKSLLLSMFTFTMSVMPTPNNIVKTIQSMLFKFLWNGNDKVKRISTYNDFNKGGLRMPNVEAIIKSLRLAWLKRLLNTKNAFWKMYFINALEQVGFFS